MRSQNHPSPCSRLSSRVRLVFVISILTFAACDDDESSPREAIDDCLTTSSVNAGEIIPGEYIVTFGTGPVETDRNKTIARMMQRYHHSSEKIIAAAEGETSMYLMKLSEEEAGALQKDGGVTGVEPDRVISVCGCLTVVAPGLVTWNADKVGFGDGTGKTAWVMDTGIDYDHPDLTVDRMRSRSFIDGVLSAQDDNGHGTHVAGVIGAKNNTFGMLGIASGATLVSLKILDKEGNGRLSTALKALSYVKLNAKAGDVVNISLSLEQVSEALETGIRAVASDGIYVTIAAGNNGEPANSFSPGRTSGTNIYTVSAVDSLDRFAGFSNYGNDVIDFAAPGVHILSTYPDGSYAIMSGTSMASPHVAGLLLINNGKVNTRGHALNDPDGIPDPLAHR